MRLGDRRGDFHWAISVAVPGSATRQPDLCAQRPDFKTLGRIKQAMAERWRTNQGKFVSPLAPAHDDWNARKGQTPRRLCMRKGTDQNQTSIPWAPLRRTLEFSDAWRDADARGSDDCPTIGKRTFEASMENLHEEVNRHCAESLAA